MDPYKNLKLEAASTLIHEATHLFANTIDYCYFEPWDEPKQPEKEYGDAFDNEQLALMNADSYARFVCRVGFKEG
jgi:hypothetical protein